MAWPPTAESRGDLITGLVVSTIGVVYYIATFSITLTKDIITPGTFPAIVGIALIVLGAVLIVQTLVKRAPDTSAEAAAANVVIEAPAEPKSKKVVLQFALFFAYLGLLIPVGFLLSTAAFLMSVTSIYAPDKWIRNLVFSVLFSAAVYFAFVYGLAVYLPAGILG